MNLPQAFRERMQRRLGAGFNDFEQALHAPPPVSIRFNPAKHDGPLPFAPVPWCSTACHLPERPSFTLDPLFHAGVYAVQEAGSMLTEAVLRQVAAGDRPLRVLDLCASPGGKTTLLASLLPAGSLIVANEAVRSRLPALLEQTVRWGSGNIVVTNSDPSAFEALGDFFDLVLVDAPCSGEGLFRRQPDACRHWSESTLKHCADRQKRILAAALHTLMPGGSLIYSTCTFNPEENEKNVEWMEEKLEVGGLKLEVDASWGIETVQAGAGTGWYCYPHKAQGEGFFIAAVKKPEGGSGVRRGEGGDRGGMYGKPLPGGGAELRSWLAVPEEMTLAEEDGTVLACPTAVARHLPLLRRYLRVIYAGVEMATATRQGYRPAHALALYAGMQPAAFPAAELDTGKALAYLRRGSIDLPASKPGITLMTFRGTPLGWAKVLPGRVNNLYPKAWRIRNV